MELSQGITHSDRTEVLFDSNWKERQMTKYGGRHAWIAHHMLVLQQFFKLVREKWNPDYKAKYRLVHLEQSLMLMAEVFGIDGSWIPYYLSSNTELALEQADWTLEGLKAFADYWYITRQGNPNANGMNRPENHKTGPKILAFSTNDISSWANTMEEYEKSHELGNPRILGKYLQSHLSMVKQVCKIREHGRKNNKVYYELSPDYQPPRQ